MTLPTSYQINLPNTCALCHGSQGIQYIESSSPGARIFVGAGFETFEAFETPEQAATRAVQIDPAYDGNEILGIITFTDVNVSESTINVFEGASVTINSEVASSTGDPVSYQWFFNGVVIPDATSSYISLSKVTKASAGAYSCEISCSNSYNQHGETSRGFSLNVSSAPEISKG